MADGRNNNSDNSRDVSNIAIENDPKYKEILTDLRKKYSENFEKEHGSNREEWTKEVRDKFLEGARTYDDAPEYRKPGDTSKTIYDDAKRIFEEKNARPEKPKVLSYYEKIGVDRNAPLEDVKKAWKKARAEAHPDNFMKKDEQGNIINELNVEAQERFKDIQQAKTVLGLDAETEAEYLRKRDSYLRSLEQIEQEQRSRSVYRHPDTQVRPPAPEGTSFVVPYTEYQPVSSELSSGAAQLSSGSPQLGSGIAGIAKKQFTNVAIKKGAQTQVGKAAAATFTKAVTKKVGEEAAKKAAVAAATATGAAMSMGTTLALQAGMMALSNVDKIAKGLMGAVIALPALFAGSIGAAVSGAMTNIAIAIVTVPLVLATFVIIINTGAYVVPMDEGYVFQDEENTATLECLRFEGPWPEVSLQTELEAARKISSFSTFFRDLCSAGEIKITYNPVGTRYGGFVSGGQVTIYQLGTGSLGNTLYTLAHELGHIYAGRFGGKLYQYRDTAFAREGMVCTYPYSNSFGESFAESIALYIGGRTPPAGFATGSSGNRITSCFGSRGGSFRTAMPTTWNFFKDQVFRTTQGW